MKTKVLILEIAELKGNLLFIYRDAKTHEIVLVTDNLKDFQDYLIK